MVCVLVGASPPTQAAFLFGFNQNELFLRLQLLSKIQINRFKDHGPLGLTLGIFALLLKAFTKSGYSHILFLGKKLFRCDSVGSRLLLSSTAHFFIIGLDLVVHPCTG